MKSKNIPNLHTLDTTPSSPYDEMKFIDDWVQCLNLDKKIELTEKIYDDESSFSSIINFYMKEDSQIANDDKESVQEISFEESEDSVLPDKIEMALQNISFVSSTEQLTQIENEILNSNDLYETSIKTEKTEEIKKILCCKSRQFSVESNIGNTKFRVTKTVLESPIEVDISNKTKKNYVGLNEFDISNKEEPTLAAYSLLRTVEKRVAESKKCGDTDIPLRRFVIETRGLVVHLNDTVKLSDLRNKTIIGRLYKKNTKGYYNYNWFTLKENFFTCYHSKKLKINGYNVPIERNGDLVDPEDSALFMTKKYSIDLLHSRLYLCKKKGKSDMFSCYAESIPAESDLIDITDLIVLNIIESIFGYNVILKQDTLEFNVMLTCLNFSFKTNDGYRFYKVSTVNEFLKWIIAFKFRLGQISMSIG